jgi:hypothetical protein
MNRGTCVSACASIVLLVPLLLGVARIQLPGQGAAANGDVTHVYVTLPDLPRSTYVKQAVDVVRCRVLAMHPIFPTGSVAYTDVDVIVSWALKGTAQSRLVVRVPGARDESRECLVERAPIMNPGDDMVLFLAMSGGSEIINVEGLDDGAFRVLTDRNGNERVFGRHVNGRDFHAFVADLAADLN